MNYWLMKSEPSSFSIEDLAKRPHQTEPWNGVRNFQVRNWLRSSIKRGDLAFFYHSSCKVPGIVGIMKVVKEGYPDPSAFDPTSHYYDPQSSPSQPKWYCVDVQLVKKFTQIITLEQLRRLPPLHDMKLLQKGSRLSITPVSEVEWDVITTLLSKAK